MPWTAMITNVLVLPQNFIKLKIEPSFSAEELPLKRKCFENIRVEDIYRNQMKRDMSKYGVTSICQDS